jgi:hypothetical protein
MIVCRNCGVQIDEAAASCPLCRAPLQEGEPEGETTPPASGATPAGRSAPLTRRRLWEIWSLFAGTGAAVVLVADFAYSMTVTWARYPLVSIAFLWATASLLLFLRRRRLLLLAAGTAALALFLLALDLLTPGRPWALTLALPLTVLAGALAALVSAVAQAWRARFFAMLAAVLAGAGLFVPGLEAVVNLYSSGEFRLSWSLVVFGCLLPLVGLLLYVQYRLKATRDDIRRIFHM